MTSLALLAARGGRCRGNSRPGLDNLGDTCCINGPVQCMFAVPGVVRASAARLASRRRQLDAVTREFDALLKNMQEEMQTPSIGRIAPKGLQCTVPEVPTARCTRDLPAIDGESMCKTSIALGGPFWRKVSLVCIQRVACDGIVLLPYHSV